MNIMKVMAEVQGIILLIQKMIILKLTIKILDMLNFENKYQLDQLKTYENFKRKINKIKKRTIEKFNSIIKSNKIVHGYGASTKGNVILQYFGLNNKKIKFISDRNPFKYNRYTPGTKIKIISERESRSMKPDFYFVLPWHFKKEILKREKK